MSDPVVTAAAPMFSWFNVTTWALRDWENAQRRYYDELHGARARWEHEAAHARLRAARASCRHRVLSWYWKLLTPMKLGDVVPDEVALLLAEEWSGE